MSSNDLVVMLFGSCKKLNRGHGHCVERNIEKHDLPKIDSASVGPIVAAS